MKTIKTLGLVALASLALSSCAALTTQVGSGFLYTDVTQGAAVTSNKLGSKIGKSTATNILGLIATGDASIQEAARAGGIKKITHVDTNKKSYIGIYSTTTTIVYGE